jgi:hypothetical protein
MKIDWGKVISSKTMWLGVLIIAGGIAEYLGNIPAGASIGTIVAGCITIIIRFLTTDSVIKPPVTPNATTPTIITTDTNHN